MKKYQWAGLTVLALLLAGCGAVQGSPPAQPEAQQQAAAQEAQAEEASAEGPAAEVEESVSDAPAGEESVDKEEPVAESPAAEEAEQAEASAASDQTAAPAEEETVAHTGTDPNCENPFEGVDNVRFSPDVWNAERISRFVGDELVDPASGLETNFCLHSIDYSDVLSGGPPPDGIPPIDNPEFESLEKGDEWLVDVQPVIALEVNGEARAYPLAILTWHEIVNDEIADVPVAVTFCPLCNAAVVFKREVNGDVLRFGVSGNLRNSDLIMWDNKTLSWWQQFTGEGIVGDLTGTQLEMIPAQLVAWQDFKAAHPDGVVQARTGPRNYGTNPYTGYDSTTSPFLFLGEPDPRLRATERVLGYNRGDTAVAYPMKVLAQEKVVADTLDGQDVVIFYAPGQVSALDNARIDKSKEVGSAAMFIPEVDDQKLTFKADGNKIIDNETGSEWDVFGRAVTGELEGAQLKPVLSHVHFWFAWAAFKPDTVLYGS